MKKQNKALTIAFGQRVRDLRTAKGYAQQHLANLCDVELSHINRIELGKVNTSIVHAQLIANALNISLSKLFDFKVP